MSLAIKQRSSSFFFFKYIFSLVWYREFVSDTHTHTHSAVIVSIWIRAGWKSVSVNALMWISLCVCVCESFSWLKAIITINTIEFFCLFVDSDCDYHGNKSNLHAHQPSDRNIHVRLSFLPFWKLYLAELLHRPTSTHAHTHTQCII